MSTKKRAIGETRTLTKEARPGFYRSADSSEQLIEVIEPTTLVATQKLGYKYPASKTDVAWLLVGWRTPEDQATHEAHEARKEAREEAREARLEKYRAPSFLQRLWAWITRRKPDAEIPVAKVVE